MTVERRRPWEGSTRSQRLPADWDKPGGPRDRTLSAPGGRICKLAYEDICIGYATQADHIKAGDDHSDGNRQSVCEPCHRRKSGREGRAARPSEKRPPDVHPALR